jgi:hypothetical protein
MLKLKKVNDDYYSVGETNIKILIDRTTENLLYMPCLADCFREEEDMYWISNERTEFVSSRYLKPIVIQIHNFMKEELISRKKLRKEALEEFEFHDDLINRYSNSLSNK